MSTSTLNSTIVEQPSEIIQLRIPISDATVSASVTQPYVREANGTAKLKAEIANRGITLVLPAFDEVTYDELVLTFSSTDHSAEVVSTLLAFEPGKDSVDTVKVSGAFMPGDKAKVRVFLRVTPEIWLAGNDSIEYEIL